jgi:hypothetical protein
MVERDGNREALSVSVVVLCFARGTLQRLVGDRRPVAAGRVLRLTTAGLTPAVESALGDCRLGDVESTGRSGVDKTHSSFGWVALSPPPIAQAVFAV